MRIITESIKGPIIDWNNYLTTEEIVSIKLHLHTFNTIVQKLLDEKRLELGNKTFEDLVDELKSWWLFHGGEEIENLQERRTPSKKAEDYYHRIRVEVKKIVDNNPDKDNIALANTYWDDFETLGMYKDLRNLITSKIRLRDTDLKLGVINKEKYDYENKVDDIVLDYVNKRIKTIGRPITQLEENLLLEKGRKDLLSKSKKDSPGRWERRQYYKNFNVVKTDISDLDDKDRVTVTFGVGDYIDTVSFNNILLNLREIVKQDPKHMVKFDWVIRACNRAIDQSDIFVNCTCKDFKYRLAYIASKDSYKYGKKEMRPANITNPNDDKGSMCKHLLSILSNKNWMTRVATTVNDWLQMKDVFEIRHLLNYEEANMPTDISRELGKMSARAKGVR